MAENISVGRKVVRHRHTVFTDFAENKYEFTQKYFFFLLGDQYSSDFFQIAESR